MLRERYTARRKAKLFEDVIKKTKDFLATRSFLKYSLSSGRLLPQDKEHWGSNNIGRRKAIAFRGRGRC